MKRPYTDKDILNFLKGFTESKEAITRKYVLGLISKDEFLKRMNKTFKTF